MSELHSRRVVLRGLAAGGAVAVLPFGVPRVGAAPNGGPYGPLGPPDALGLRLPEGFTSRLVAETGKPVGDSGFIWHGDPDGGATFPTVGGGWIYVSNSEISNAMGGASMIRFDATGNIIDSRSILQGTYRNCSGGPTPWGTWLSCEEIGNNGQVYECDPFGVRRAHARPAMGYFSQEAAVVDPEKSIVYMTEDRVDSGLYRFLPDVGGDLSSGTLEVMVEVGGAIGWETIPDPRGRPTETRFQVPNMKVFNRGEGAFFSEGRVVVATTGDDRVWSYTPATNHLEILYDRATSPEPVLSGSDNLTVSDTGDVFVCEDGGNLELVVLPAEGGANPFLRVKGQSGTELTGVAFDPSGTRLYFSSQRNPGQTYEITGPFRTGLSVPEPFPDPEPEPETEPEPFVCSAVDGKLSWSDQGIGRYFIRSVNGGVERYLGESAGLSFAVSGADEAYIVRYRVRGQVVDAICAGHGGPPAPEPEPEPFGCSVVDGVLSWNDQGVGRFFIRAVNGGVERYLGETAGLSFAVSGADEAYIVRYWVNGQRIDATCAGHGGPAPEPEPEPFGCSVVDGVLSWNDQGVGRYFIRRVNGGVDRYLGESAGLSFTVSGTDEAYIVRYRVGGQVFDAICEP